MSLTLACSRCQGNFRDENFTKLLATFGKDKDGELGSKLANGGKITDRPPPKRKGAPEKTENKDIIKIIKVEGVCSICGLVDQRLDV